MNHHSYHHSTHTLIFTRRSDCHHIDPEKWKNHVSFLVSLSFRSQLLCVVNLYFNLKKGFGRISSEMINTNQLPSWKNHEKVLNRQEDLDLPVLDEVPLFSG
ncbi:hypothetical protein Tco_1419259 [Tanacetum coccineum]